MEGRGEILWEECQSNYRQRCSPGFLGVTKITFQLALPLSTFSPLRPGIFFYFHSSRSTVCMLPFPICVFCSVYMYICVCVCMISNKSVSPFSCVMSKCIRSLRHRGSCVSQNWSLSGFCRAAADPHRGSLPFCCLGHLQEGMLAPLKTAGTPADAFTRLLPP